MNSESSTPEAVRVCASSELVDGGPAVKLPARDGGGPATVFFVRYGGEVYGYLNRCTHRPQELDWEGSIFTRAGDLLMCVHHGATFFPDTGLCMGGAPKGSKLHALSVREDRDSGDVYWTPGPKVFPA